MIYLEVVHLPETCFKPSFYTATNAIFGLYKATHKKVIWHDCCIIQYLRKIKEKLENAAAKNYYDDSGKKNFATGSKGPCVLNTS